jgi:hypothetical protein
MGRKSVFEQDEVTKLTAIWDVKIDGLSATLRFGKFRAGYPPVFPAAQTTWLRGGNGL